MATSGCKPVPQNSSMLISGSGSHFLSFCSALLGSFKRRVVAQSQNGLQPGSEVRSSEYNPLKAEQTSGPKICPSCHQILLQWKVRKEQGLISATGFLMTLLLCQKLFHGKRAQLLDKKQVLASSTSYWPLCIQRAIEQFGRGKLDRPFEAFEVPLSTSCIENLHSSCRKTDYSLLLLSFAANIQVSKIQLCPGPTKEAKTLHRKSCYVHLYYIFQCILARTKEVFSVLKWYN